METPIASLVLAALLVVGSLAQEPGPPDSGPGQGPPPPNMSGAEMGSEERGSLTERAWWKDRRIMRKLRLSDDQRQKVEEIASAHDAQESELRATIEKATLALRLLMESETLEDEQVLAQGDKLSRMRAQLVRSQLEMSLAMRHVLTMEQAKTLHKLTQRNTDQRGGFEPPMGPPPLSPPGQ